MKRFYHSYYFFLFVFAISFFYGCSRYAKVKAVQSSNKIINKSIEEDKVIKAMIEPYRVKIAETMDKELCVSTMNMLKGMPESHLGNFFSDAFLKKGNEYYKKEFSSTIDICILNNTGFRGSLTKGVVTKRKIYEIFPFENKLTVLTLTGKQTQELLNYVAFNGGEAISGVKMGINKDSIAVDVFIQNQPINKNNNYRVITSDYLAHIGYKFFKNPIKEETLSIPYRDLILEYLAEQGKNGIQLTAKLDGRIYHAK